MVIKYTDFQDGIHQIRFDKPVEKLGLEDSFFGVVSVDCRLDKSIHQIVIACDVKVGSNFECDRCGSSFKQIIDNHFCLVYLFVKDNNISEGFNVKYISPEQDKIDITEDVLEYMNLAIPMKKLCKEDCKGLCTVCGVNLNEKLCGCKIEKSTDIWEPLKKIKFNN